MSNKVKIIVAIATAIGLISSVAVFAEENTDSMGITYQNNQVNSTTGSEVSVDINSSINTTTSAAITIDETIEQQFFDSEYKKAHFALKIFKATNDTTKEDIINSIKDSVDSSINVTFNDDFNKKEATTEESGEITGTLVIKDHSYTKDIAVNLSIDQLNIVGTTQTDIGNTINNEITTQAAVTVNNIVTRLVTKLNSVESNTITVNIIGYNKANEKVELDKSKLSYKWIAENKETNETEVIGTDEQLVINSKVNEETIHCDVSYDENEGGTK